MKERAKVIEALETAIREVYREFRTNTGALSDAGASYVGFLRNCVDRIESDGCDVITDKEYFTICDGDEYDRTLYAWDDVPKIQFSKAQ